MDDPWGSPWADEVQHTVVATTNVIADKQEDDEGTPKTPVKASTSAPEDKTKSPWDDEDDGFGEWAAVPTVEEARGCALALDGTGDTWQSRDPGDNRDEIKSELNGLSPSLIAHTPPPVDNIPKLAPSLMPYSVPIVRQPSPDRWASETTLNDEDHKGRGVRLEGSVQGRRSMKELSREKSEVLVEHDIEPPELLSGLHETIPQSAKTDGSDLQSLESRCEEDTPRPAHWTAEDANGHESSRPSSSPSDQSHHEVTLVESPRTSLDEEPKRPQGTTKVSSKIQELVEHFDGLAEQSEDIAIEPSRSRSRSKTPSLHTEKIIEVPKEPKAVDKKEDDAEEDDDDFGDFEDGQSEVEGPIEEEEVNRPVAPSIVQNEIASSPASKMARPQRSPLRSHYVKKDYGRVEFAVGASALDELYAQSGGACPNDAPAEKVFVMDAIPLDSFYSLEERKTWYRISRYGSMRKHNSGDDENYIRVTWPQSQVREQTLKTVARWMEEDRLSGRVVLGGGSKGSSLFGWNDPNTLAIPLSSAFAANKARSSTPVNASVEAIPEVPRELPKGLARDRPTSESRTSSKARRRSSEKLASISESHEGSSHAPVANFGWSASPMTEGQSPILSVKDVPKAAHSANKAASPPRQLRSLDPRPTASSISIPRKAIESRESMKSLGRLDTLFSKSAVPVIPLTTIPVSKEEDEEDDWGEMVASPVVAKTPVLSSTQGLGYGKPQSPIGAFSPATHTSAVGSPVSTLSARSHKSPTTFDEILMPRSRDSLESNLDVFQSNAFTTASPSFFSKPAFQPSPVSVPATSNNDPWASADFSFFDSPAPASKPMPPKPMPPKPKPQKSATFAKALPAPSPLWHGKTRQEIEQDEIVARIVKGLPDLSYMLR